jgi:hypothetical protein
MFFYNYNEGEGQNSVDDTTDLTKVENLQAWVKYCEGKISEKEIQKGVYESIHGSMLESYLKKHKNQLAIDYLYFVQELEQKEASTSDIEKDTKTLDYLSYDVEILTQLFRRAKNDFMKERIVFQMVKTLSKAKNTKKRLRTSIIICYR